MDTQFLDDILAKMLAIAQTEHDRELAVRGNIYAKRRVLEGHATTENEAKLAYAAFSDGFCTGYSSGTGIPCSHR